jgi:hypothetical protein
MFRGYSLLFLFLAHTYTSLFFIADSPRPQTHPAEYGTFHEASCSPQLLLACLRVATGTGGDRARR